MGFTIATKVYWWLMLNMQKETWISVKGTMHIGYLVKQKLGMQTKSGGPVVGPSFSCKSSSSSAIEGTPLWSWGTTFLSSSLLSSWRLPNCSAIELSKFPCTSLLCIVVSLVVSSQGFCPSVTAVGWKRLFLCVRRRKENFGLTLPLLPDKAVTNLLSKIILNNGHMTEKLRFVYN